MPGGRQPMKTLPMLVALLCLGFSSLAVADDPVASELRWNVSEDFLHRSPKVTVVKKSKLDAPFNTELYTMGAMPRNGDFSRYQSHGRPAEWNPAVESGKHDFRLDPAATGREFLLPPSAAVIATREAGRAYYFQEVSLLPGEYRLEVETSGTVGAIAQIVFATEGAEVTTGKMDLKRRIDLVRLSHAILTHMRSQNETTANPDLPVISQTAQERANALRSNRGFMVKLPTARTLKPR